MHKTFIFFILLLTITLYSCESGERVDLSKGWKIEVGDSAEYKKADFNDSGWDSIELPAMLVKEKKRNIIWLRKSFFLPAEYRNRDLAIEIGKLWDTDQTYINGIKIGASGTDFPDFFSLWNYDRYYMIPENVLKYGDTNVISIRIFSNCISFFDGSPFISTIRTVMTYNFFKRLFAEYIVIGLTVLSVFFGIFSLVQYISFPKFKTPLYYSICSLLVGVMSIQFYLPDIMGMTYITKDNIFYAVMTLVIAFFYFLIENLLYTRNRIFRLIIICAMVFTVGISLTASATDPVQNWRILIIGTLTFLAYILCGILLFRSIINRVTKEVVILLFGYFVNMLFVFNDIFMMENIITPGTFLIPIAFNILYICLGVVLALRTSEMQTAKNIAEKSRDHYINEINLAKKIQEKLIPSAPPFEFIHTLYKPVEDVGGDFYDFIQFEESDNIGIFISDVSGHGLQAAFITSMIKTTILQSGTRKEDPAELLIYINEVLHEQTADNFITAFYGIYNPSDKTFRYANAGHPQPYVITHKNISQLQKGKNTALALFSNNLLSEINKDYINFQIKLPENSKLLFFTDGLVETRPLNNYNISFELAQMSDVIRENEKYTCKEFINNLYQRLVKFRGTDSFEDDICLVCLDIK